MKPRVSFVVLFYRDAPTVRPVIAALDQVLSDSCTDYEIIAIDDHSPDDTGKAIDQVARGFPRVRPLHNESNLGVGGSFRRAVAAAKFAWIGYTDGDDQYEVEDLRTFWPHLADHDVVSGFRIHRADGWYRALVSRHFNWITNQLFGLQLRDTNSALKVYRAKPLKGLASWDACAFYDTEILVKLTRDHGAKIKECPIRHRNRSHGAAAGLSAANVSSVIGGMVGPAMADYRSNSVLPRLLIGYCHSLLALHRLTHPHDHDRSAG